MTAALALEESGRGPRDVFEYLDGPGVIVACGISSCGAISFFAGVPEEARILAGQWFKEHKQNYHGIRIKEGAGRTGTRKEQGC